MLTNHDLIKIIFWILNGIDPSPIAPSNTLSYSDVTVGIPLLVNCLLMVPFSVFFHYAYDVKPYKLSSYAEQESWPMDPAGLPPRYHGGPLGIKAWFQVWSPVELISAIFFSFKMSHESSGINAKQQAIYYETELAQAPVRGGRSHGHHAGRQEYAGYHSGYGQQNRGAPPPVYGGRY